MTGRGSARDERPATARASGRGRVARERDGGWFVRMGAGSRASDGARADGGPRSSGPDGGI